VDKSKSYSDAVARFRAAREERDRRAGLYEAASGSPSIEANGIDRRASCSRRGPGCGGRPGGSVLGVLVGAGGDETGVLAREPGVPTTA
jgi:hypothetical protein